MMTAQTKTERGPCRMSFGDGRWFAFERQITTVSDVRETILGAVDFGHVRLGPLSMVEVDG